VVEVASAARPDAVLSATPHSCCAVAEQVVADRWNGTQPANGQGVCGLADTAFPRLTQPAVKRYPLLAAARAARVAVSVHAGDVLYIPPCTPHQIAPRSACMFTTLRWIDSMSWYDAFTALSHSTSTARADHEEPHTHAEGELTWLSHLEALHASPAPPLQKDVPLAEWGAEYRAGHAASHVGHDEL
jgi:hypothetical protein